MPSVSTPTKSGIVEEPTGERHIPASIRADGSKRKEIKIRPGYAPPEDVELYKNRAADTFRNRGAGPPPGSASVDENDKPGSAASEKNKKRKEARKRAAEAAAKSSPALMADSWRKAPEAKDEKKEEVDPEVEREKKVRNLKKKLKQAKELKEKKESGGELLPEQFAKVIKINELIRELEQLGFDAEGEPKAKDDKPAQAETEK